ncbi:MAG: hypothetical protein KDB00_19825 [Planctomycetales bacterium]|nr:hypothetical protein [Planctomycetales bacterium]
MNKQKKAIIAIACTSGLSLIVWMICAVLYFSGPQRVVAASNPSRSEDSAAKVSHGSDATEAENAADSPQVSSDTSLKSQADSSGHSTETESVDHASALEHEGAGVPVDNKLDGRFPFTVFDKPVAAVTIDPTHHRILLSGIQANSLSMMGIDQIGLENPQIQSIDVDGTPEAVALKKWKDQMLYVVATTSPSRLVLIDSESMEVVRRVQLNSFVPERLWDHLDASSPVIVIGKNSEKFEFEFDSRRGFVRGVSNAVEFDIESMAVTRKSHGAVWDVTPSGRCLFTLENSPINIGPFPHQTETSPIEADSIGDRPLTNQIPTLVDDMVVFGQTLYRAQELSEPIGVMEFEVLSSMAGTTLLAGTIGQTFRVGTRHGTKTLFDIDLPEQWKVSSTRRSRYDSQTTFVMADSVSETFVLVSADRIAAFPLKEMGVKATADLALSAMIPTASVGELLSVPISGHSELKTLQLEKSPEGLTLQSNVLHWTPTIDQVGDHELEIRHTAGDESAVTRFAISVERSGLELPFEVTAMFDSPTGRHSLVVGRRINSERRWVPLAASVDLSTKKILASKQVVEGAKFLVGDRYVYRAYPGFEIFDRTTLEPINNQPGPQEFIVQPRTLTQWKKLESLLDDFGNNLQQIESELRQPSPEDGIGWKNPHWNWGSRQPSFGETGFGQIRNGVLYDRSTNKPRLLIWPAYTRNEIFGSSDNDGPGIGFWHPFPARVSHFKNNQLENATRQGAHVFAPELLKGAVEKGDVALISSTLDGEVASKLVVKRLKKHVGHNVPQRNYVYVSATADVVRVGYDGRLYFIDRKEFPPPTAPFHVIPTQTAFAAVSGQKITLKYTAEGAQRYALRIKENVKPIALRSDDGVFTFELEANISAMADSFVRSVASRRFPIEERRTALQKAIEASQIFFMQVVGREASGVALPIQVLVDAQREDLKTTGLVHDVLYEVPKELVVQALERDHEAFEELQRKASQKREQRGDR